MKERQNIFILPLLIMVVLLVFSSSCEKDDDESSTGNSTAVFNPDVTYGTMTDQDGNVYKTITIGTQTWMAENLRTTTYNNGTTIPNVTDVNEFDTLLTGAYCNFNNTTSKDTIATYGRLYNWYAVNTGNLAPDGWHIPTNEEWSTLMDYLGGDEVAGGKLKEIGTSHWNSPNSDATNETGFTALPGGYLNAKINGLSQDIGVYGFWWSTDESSESSALMQVMTYSGSYVNRGPFYKHKGFSVRCVKD